MPDYLILLSTLGGLGLFGITGFVAGPVLAALFLTVWQMFEEESPGGSGAPLPTGQGLSVEPAPVRPDGDAPAQKERA
jgi:predicted PurR-regulated permease PerM